MNTLGYIESLKDYDALLQNGISAQCIGRANNLLVAPDAKHLIALSKNFDYIKDLGDCLEVGAATPSGKLFSYAKHRDLGGFEILSKLPGSIGGIIKMNAGLKEYAIKDVLLGILQLGNDAKLTFKNVESLGLSYRYSRINGMIFAGIFKKQKGLHKELVEQFAKMRDNQPKEPSFGSCFKNPKGYFAGALIEQAGLKGKRFGKNKNLMFSDKHGNFLVHCGTFEKRASFEEVLELIELAQTRVLEKYGIALEKEVQILF